MDLGERRDLSLVSTAFKHRDLECLVHHEGNYAQRDYANQAFYDVPALIPVSIIVSMLYGHTEFPYPDGVAQDQGSLLGGRIKAARKLLGLNQTEFGSKLGVDQSAISRWERGQVQPDCSQLMQIGVLVRKPLHWFLRELNPEYDGLMRVTSPDMGRVLDRTHGETHVNIEVDQIRREFAACLRDIEQHLASITGALGNAKHKVAAVHPKTTRTGTKSSARR